MSSTTRVIAMLACLDGPNVSHQDLEWVNDLPAGKKLLDFLASQVQFVEGEAFALRDIALEKEEVQLWEKAVETGLATLDEPSPLLTTSYHTELTRVPEDYSTPSSVRIVYAQPRSLLDCIEEEQALLDDHLKALNQRIAQAREAVRQAAHARKTLHTVRDQTSESVSRLSESLTELSFMTDTTLVTAVRLLDAFSSIHGNLNQLSSSQFQQKDSHDHMTHHRIDELRLEVQRLAGGIEELEEQRVIDELEKMCQSLHEGTSLEKLLSADEWTFIADCAEDQRWPAVAVEQAWNLEQAIDMQHRTEELKEFAEILRDVILPPLALISASVNLLDESGKEVQVVIQALRDELADIEPDHGPVDVESNDRHTTRFPDGGIDLEMLAKGLLKRLHNSGPENLPSLTLLERQDVLSQLSSIRDGHHTAYADASKAWCSASSTPSVSASSQNYLLALMAHSPMNTDLPVSLPPSIHQEVSQARVGVSEASRNLGNIPETSGQDYPDDDSKPFLVIHNLVQVGMAKLEARNWQITAKQ
ncbi:hypothetical protein JB92DRAFT_2831543 [Gautieria morchelliformis]|nr:hypothetical protein JB92DRAFT_2831543 [Gautieria morchelliformis]